MRRGAWWWSQAGRRRDRILRELAAAPAQRAVEGREYARIQRAQQVDPPYLNSGPEYRDLLVERRQKSTTDRVG
jgi:hypothetical protein